MKRPLAPVALALLAALAAAAQPVANSIENNYSFIPLGLPNYGIAQGSIFVVFGTGLATTSSPLQSVPLKTTLDQVSVQFNVQGTTTQALLYYVTPTQIAGILPSATPAGDGTVTVTNGGQPSAPLSFTVVQSAIGLLTQGFLAWAMDGAHQLLPGLYAANPGETLLLYGTGAGPVSGDESIQQTPQNLSNIPLEIDIGGISATVSYHGRSIYPGLDQFNVVVPSGVTGCNVTVSARSGTYGSNVATIPIAASGRTCSDPVNGTASVQVNGTGSTAILGGLALAAAETFSFFSSGPVGTTVDSGAAYFQEISIPSGVTLTTGLGNPFPSLGNCFVNSFAIPIPATPPAPTPQPPLANAGPAINFTGPNGFASLPYGAGLSGEYQGPLSLITGQVFIPPNGGIFTIDNGSGGPDIGAFKQQVSVPPPLVWTNVASIGASVDRTQPLTVQWTGGNSTGYVQILGQSSLKTSGEEIGTSFQCNAPASAGQFTVPSWVLMALPPQPSAQPGGPSLTIETTFGSTFTAPGMAAGLVSVSSSAELPVGFE